MTEEANSNKPLSRREMRAAQRRQEAGEDPIVSSQAAVDRVASEAEKPSIFVQPEIPRDVRYTPGSSPRETLFYGDSPRFVASEQPVQNQTSTQSFEVDDIGADLPTFEVPRSSFLDSLLNGTFRAESLLDNSPLTESLIKETLGEEVFEEEVAYEQAAVAEPSIAVEPEPEVTSDSPESPVFELETPVPTPASTVQEPPVQSEPIPVFKVSEPEVTAEPAQTQKPAASASEDTDEGLFRIPTSLTGDVATASIVVENATNPLDIIANPATGSIPIRTGTIDIQLPESRAKLQAPRTDPIRSQFNRAEPATGIVPLKSQTIALTGELGHARGVNFKPIDTQKYWVLGTGLLMVVVGAATLVSFLMGYLR